MLFFGTGNITIYQQMYFIITSRMPNSEEIGFIFLQFSDYLNFVWWLIFCNINYGKILRGLIMDKWGKACILLLEIIRDVERKRREMGHLKSLEYPPNCIQCLFFSLFYLYLLLYKFLFPNQKSCPAAVNHKLFQTKQL